MGLRAPDRGVIGCFAMTLFCLIWESCIAAAGYFGIWKWVFSNGYGGRATLTSWCALIGWQGQGHMSIIYILCFKAMWQDYFGSRLVWWWIFGEMCTGVRSDEVGWEKAANGNNQDCLWQEFRKALCNEHNMLWFCILCKPIWCWLETGLYIDQAPVLFLAPHAHWRRPDVRGRRTGQTGTADGQGRQAWQTGRADGQGRRVGQTGRADVYQAGSKAYSDGLAFVPFELCSFHVQQCTVRQFELTELIKLRKVYI